MIRVFSGVPGSYGNTRKKKWASWAKWRKREGRAHGVVVLSLTVEWGVGMERQGPSYGEVVNTRDVLNLVVVGSSPTVGANCRGSKSDSRVGGRYGEARF